MKLRYAMSLIPLNICLMTTDIYEKSKENEVQAFYSLYFPKGILQTVVCLKKEPSVITAFTLRIVQHG